MERELFQLVASALHCRGKLTRTRPEVKMESIDVYGDVGKDAVKESDREQPPITRVIKALEVNLLKNFQMYPEIQVQKHEPAKRCMLLYVNLSLAQYTPVSC